MYNEQIEFHTFINSVTEETEVNGGTGLRRILEAFPVKKLLKNYLSVLEKIVCFI